jgi:NitT/TauT family transport system permease protein
MSPELLARVPTQYRRPELLSVIILATALAVVEVGVSAGLISPILLRQPTVVFSNLIQAIGTDALQTDFFTTARRIAITFLISIVVGMAMSIVLWQHEILRKAYLPLLGAVFGTPLVLLYLVFVVLFGRGSVAIIAISVPLGVIPIVINTTDALSNVEEVYLDIARSFNATSGQMFRKVIVPDAAPDIFTGVRIGFSYIVISVTAVEFLLVIGKGLGGMIANTYFRFNTTKMFTGITLVVLIVIAAIFILRQVEAVIRR